MKFLNFHQDPHKNKIFLVKKGVPATPSDPAPPPPCTPWLHTYNKLMAINVLVLTSENAVSGIIYSLLRGRQNIFLTLFVVKCRVLTRSLKIGVKMLPTEKVRVLLHVYFSIETWKKVGVNTQNLQLMKTLKCATKTLKISGQIQKLCPKIFLNREFSIENYQGREVIIFSENLKNLNNLF